MYPINNRDNRETKEKDACPFSFWVLEFWSTYYVI